MECAFKLVDRLYKAGFTLHSFVVCRVCHYRILNDHCIKFQNCKKKTGSGKLKSPGKTQPSKFGLSSHNSHNDVPRSAVRNSVVFTTVPYYHV